MQQYCFLFIGKGSTGLCKLLVFHGKCAFLYINNLVSKLPPALRVYDCTIYLQVFGIYERTTHTGYITFVDTRDAATLIPSIQAHVHPSTIIHSDGWAAYNTLAQLGYVHEVIIHDQQFVDPVTGVHTHGVETYWSHAKQKTKAVYGSRLHMIPSYLDEFMWRERYGLTGVHTFDNMLAVLEEH